MLIPRPETEVLVERSLTLLAGIDRPRVLGIGVGSGAVALAIADEHAGAQVVATDRSADALAAEGGRACAGLDGRVSSSSRARLFAGVEGP